MPKLLQSLLAAGLLAPSVAWSLSLPQIKVFTNTSAQMAHPSIIVTVPSGYKVISGGAQVDYGAGAGSLLTASFPFGNNGWMARAKDADISSPAKITAYAVAINDPDNQWTVCSNQVTSGAQNWPIARVELFSGCALTGGGAVANWDQSSGGL